MVATIFHLRVWNVPHCAMPEENEYQASISNNANYENKSENGGNNVGCPSLFVRFVIWCCNIYFWNRCAIEIFQHGIIGVRAAAIDVINS